MGTLGGHLIAGLLFLIVVLYYSVLVSLALLRGQRFLKSPLPPRDKRGHRWWQLVSVEAVVKVVFSLIVILPELFYPPGTNRMVMVDWEDRSGRLCSRTPGSTSPCTGSSSSAEWWIS